MPRGPRKPWRLRGKSGQPWGLRGVWRRPVPIRALRILFLLTWAWLIVAASITAILWIAGDRWWPATVLLFGPRWLLLLPGLVLTVAAIALRPRLLVPAGAAVLIALFPGMGLRTGWRGWFGSPQRQLRIVTFNAEGSVNPLLPQVPGALLRYEPDVVVFQECAGPLELGTNWPRGWTVPERHGGICMATRLRLQSVTELPSIATGDQGGTGNAVRYRLVVRDTTVDLVVVHLETPRKGLALLRREGRADRMDANLTVRRAGAMRISHWIFDQSPGAIIAGDFNMPVESRIYVEAFGDCRNVFSRVGRGFGFTRILRWFSVRIDHVLSCGTWKPVHVMVGPDLGSDHLPLIADLVRP